jgi:hypothetical protein
METVRKQQTWDALSWTEGLLSAACQELQRQGMGSQRYCFSFSKWLP